MNRIIWFLFAVIGVCCIVTVMMLLRCRSKNSKLVWFKKETLSFLTCIITIALCTGCAQLATNSADGPTDKENVIIEQPQPGAESDADTVSSQSASAVTPQDASEERIFITYDTAFNYIKQCEENIINSNKGLKPNKYGESAAEKIIFSDEYAGLYCAYWSALEQIGEQDDSRFEKSKLRWQVDYTNEEWRMRMIEAYESGGYDVFTNEYASIYREEVFPAVEERWKKEQ